MTSRLKAKLLAQRSLLQRLQNSKKLNKGEQGGFTLIELLIVVIIIGILAAIALPAFLNQRDRAYYAQAKSWASAEARKCAASWAAINSGGDFTATPAPTNLGTQVTIVTTGTCATIAASTWAVRFTNTNGTVSNASYAVQAGGALVTSDS